MRPTPDGGIDPIPRLDNFGILRYNEYDKKFPFSIDLKTP